MDFFLVAWLAGRAPTARRQVAAGSAPECAQGDDMDTPQSPAAQAVILVVDDTPDNLMLMASLLKPLYYSGG
jgi:hypothetical protein